MSSATRTATGSAEGRTLARVQQAVTAMALVTVLGIMAELAVARHWGTPQLLIPWAACALVLVALALVARGTTPATLRAARGVLAAVSLSSAYGVWTHISSNHSSGPLDFRYATSWSTFSPTRQWWMAATGGVGPSPPFVPLMLTLVAGLVLVASGAGRQ